MPKVLTGGRVYASATGALGSTDAVGPRGAHRSGVRWSLTSDLTSQPSRPPIHRRNRFARNDRPPLRLRGANARARLAHPSHSPRSAEAPVAWFLAVAESVNPDRRSIMSKLTSGYRVLVAFALLTAASVLPAVAQTGWQSREFPPPNGGWLVYRMIGGNP